MLDATLVTSDLDDNCMLEQTTAVTVVYCETKYYVYKSSDLVQGTAFKEIRKISGNSD